MFKDWKFLKWVVGLLLLAVSAGTSYGLVLARVKAIESETAELKELIAAHVVRIDTTVLEVKELISGLSDNLVGLENKSRDEGWEDYSAWHYQLQVNNVILEALEIPKHTRPVPPNYLRERP